MKKQFTILMCLFLIGTTMSVASPLGFDNDDGTEISIFNEDNSQEVIIVSAMVDIEAGNVELLKSETISTLDSAVMPLESVRSAKECEYECLLKTYSNLYNVNSNSGKTVNPSLYAKSWFSF